MKHLITALALILITPQVSAQSFLTENLPLPGAANSIKDQILDQAGGGQGVGAINQYDDKYKGGPPPSKGGAAGGANPLIGSDNYRMYFIRHTNDADGIATLRIENPVGIQGCATVSIPPARLEKRGPGLFITVDDPQVSVDKSIRYPHYQCKSSGGTPKLDIDLNRDDLMDDGIKHITMESSSGKQKFNLYVSDNSISLTPAASGPFTLAGKPGAGSHHFYDQRTIMLYAPAIGNDPALSAKINAIADTHNLIPLESAPRQGNNFYFIDKNKSLSTRLRSQNSIKLDTLEIDDIFRGANGPYTVKRQIDVFASRPGALD